MSKSGRVQEWKGLKSSRMGIVGIHPAVFVRMASKELAGYGTWKNEQRAENNGLQNAFLFGKVR